MMKEKHKFNPPICFSPLANYSNEILNYTSNSPKIKPVQKPVFWIYRSFFIKFSLESTFTIICGTIFFKNQLLKKNGVQTIRQGPFKEGLGKVLRTICTGKGQKRWPNRSFLSLISVIRGFFYSCSNICEFNSFSKLLLVTTETQNVCRNK